MQPFVEGCRGLTLRRGLLPPCQAQGVVLGFPQQTVRASTRVRAPAHLLLAVEPVPLEHEGHGHVPGLVQHFDLGRGPARLTPWPQRPLIVLNTHTTHTAGSPRSALAEIVAPHACRCLAREKAYAGLCSREHKHRWIVPPGAQILLNCAPGSTIQQHVCSREHNPAVFVLPGAHCNNICAPGSTNSASLCSRGHNTAEFALSGAPSSDICARGSTVQQYLCCREHNPAVSVLPGAQFSSIRPQRSTIQQHVGHAGTHAKTQGWPQRQRRQETLKTLCCTTEQRRNSSVRAFRSTRGKGLSTLPS